MSEGWDASAQAWIESLGVEGDWGRRYVLDAPMLAQTAGRGFRRAVDIGCGEGRFCRMLQAQGIATVGIDPTVALITAARERDPQGDYRVGHGESLELDDQSVDLAVAYLSLIDIDDHEAAIREAWRVLAPGGELLIANLTSFNTAGLPDGWTRDLVGRRRYVIDNYLDARAEWTSWKGIRIRNWHRPMQDYLGPLLNTGFHLRHFAEPAPVGVTGEKAERYRRVPYFLIMHWQKPA